MRDRPEISDELRAYIRAELPQQIDRGMAFFKGIKIEETRECLLASLRRISDPETATEFRMLTNDIEVFWLGISPDVCLHPLRFKYAWLCSISLALWRLEWRSNHTRKDLGPNTREVIEQHTMMMIHLAEQVPACTIDAEYLSKISVLTVPADRALELKAALRWEIKMYRDEFVSRPLRERLRAIIEEKVTDDAAVTWQVKEMEAIVEELIRLKKEAALLGRKEWYVYELFTVIRAMAKTGDEAQYLRAAKTVVAELRRTGHLPCGGGMNAVAKQRLALALQAACRISGVRELGLCPEGEEQSAFLVEAVGEWARGRSRLIHG